MAMTGGSAKVREAVAVFDDVSALESAFDELRAAGFAKDQISLLAADAVVERKLGHCTSGSRSSRTSRWRRAPRSSPARRWASARTGCWAR